MLDRIMDRPLRSWLKLAGIALGGGGLGLSCVALGVAGIVLPSTRHEATDSVVVAGAVGLLLVGFGLVVLYWTAVGVVGEWHSGTRAAIDEKAAFREQQKK